MRENTGIRRQAKYASVRTGSGVSRTLGVSRGLQQMCARARVSQGCCCNTETHLTDREIQVLLLVAIGLGNRVIGRDLGISPRTVEEHLAVMRKRVGARDRAELVARCYAAEILLPTWPPAWSGRNCPLTMVSPYAEGSPLRNWLPPPIAKLTGRR